MSALPLRERGELWLAQAALAWQKAFAPPVENHMPQAWKAYDIAPAQGTQVPQAASAGIPRIIWAYWSGGPPPELIARCFANWRRHCPDYDIRILNEESAAAWLPPMPDTLLSATAPKRADWVRLALLQRHGGIWLDASTILTQSLDWVLAEQARLQSDFVGYYLDRYTSDPAVPVVENWFMAAPPGSRFIADLQHEFSTQVVMRSNADYVTHLQQLGLYEQLRQRIEIPHYLSMHLALQYILRTRGGYRLALARAEDGPFFYHAHSHWRRTGLKLRLLMRASTGRALPPVIKLRKPDRKRLDLYVAHGLLRADSILASTLYPPAP